MKKSQIMGMDLLIALIIFIIALSVFFYSMRNFLFVKNNPNLEIEADLIFSSIENIPNHRLKFLTRNIIDEKKLVAFSKMSYLAEDSDFDGLLDDVDLVPDSADGDKDNDGYIDILEYELGTNPNDGGSKPRDDDNDFMDDNWEEKNFAEPKEDVGSNYEAIDGDITSLEDIRETNIDFDYNCNGEFDEFRYLRKDANYNGVLDVKINSGKFFDGSKAEKCTIFGYTAFDLFNPGCIRCIPNLLQYNHDKKHVDYDNDGLNDINEINIYKTSISSPDSDGDGLLDGVEIKEGLDPWNNDGIGFNTLFDIWAEEKGLLDLPIELRDNFADPDFDLRNNELEYLYDTDPLKKDTDGDGADDFSDQAVLLPPSLYDIVLSDINTLEFDKIDFCIYFQKSDGSEDIIRHLGPDIEDIKLSETINCGNDMSNINQQTVLNPSPICSPNIYTHTIALSKPVYYKYIDGSIILINMKVLICAETD